VSGGAQGILQSFDHLASDVRARLRSLLREETFPAGQQIFAQEAPTSIFCIIAAGRVKVARVTPDGFEIMLCVRGPGEFLCPVTTLDGEPQLGTAVAMTDVTILQADRDAFMALCHKYPALLAVLQSACLGEVRHLIRRMETLAFGSVRNRLIHFLVTWCRRLDPSGSISAIRLTHQELGSLVGASRESVSRCLAQLQREGLVELKRGRVVIRDRERLEALTGEVHS